MCVCLGGGRYCFDTRRSVGTPWGVFSRHFWRTEMTWGPALTSVKPLDQWHLCLYPLVLQSAALPLETRTARGDTHVLPRPLPLPLLDCTHVLVCVCPGPLVYPWPLLTVITTHSCHLNRSLSLFLPVSHSVPPSTYFWSRQRILMSLTMINLINNKYINLASWQGLILSSGKAQAPVNCCL